ncbi:hypothetical protein F5Y15DRAFT_118486 [Xylariaceae sp. FL0016]|nr:hypothetical protein F5Y15DRAFT_118486 [Xylariaceae sp. FL0016]
MAGNRNLGLDVNPAGTNFFIVQVVLLVMTWTVSALRTYVKLFIQKRITIDDYLMLLALAGYTSTAYFVLIAVSEGGTGKPSDQLTDADNALSLRSWYINEVLSGPVSAAIRISIAILALRIAVVRWHKWILFAVIGLTSVLSLTYFFVVLFQCSPPSYFWTELEGASGRCLDPSVIPAVTMGFGAFSIVMDWIVGLLPIAMLWNVRINLRTKVSVAALLSLGILAGIALLVRMFYLNQARIASRDFVRATINVATCAIIELALGIIAGCVATLPPLFKRIRIGISLESSKRSSHRVSAINRHSSFMSRKQRKERPRTLPRRSLFYDANSDEIQLQGARPDTAQSDMIGALTHWDIERGKDGSWAPADMMGIEIRTSIDVTSHSLDGAIVCPEGESPEEPRAGSRSFQSWKTFSSEDDHSGSDTLSDASDSRIAKR